MNQQQEIDNLKNILNNLLNYVELQTNLYSDLRNKIVEKKIKEKSLTFTGIINIISMKPQFNWIELEILNKDLHKISTTLHEFKKEQINTEIQSKNTFEELNKEKKNLIFKIKELKKI